MFLEWIRKQNEVKIKFGLKTLKNLLEKLEF